MIMSLELLLQCLYNLTEIENNLRHLTDEETDFYVYCVEKLKSNDIEIPFGINI